MLSAPGRFCFQDAVAVAVATAARTISCSALTVATALTGSARS